MPKPELRVVSGNARNNISLSVCIGPSLQLGLFALLEKIGHQHVSDFTGSFVKVEAHPLCADLLADDVELEAANHVSSCITSKYSY